MKIAHFAIAAVLSLGSAFIAAEPASAMPRSAAPVAAGEMSDVVQVGHRHYRHQWLASPPLLSGLAR